MNHVPLLTYSSVMHFKQYNHFLSDTTFLCICTGLPECNDFNLSFKKEKKCWSEWNWGNESKAKVIHSISISITGLHLPIQTFIIAVTISLFIKQAYTVCIYLWGLHYHHLYTCIHTHAHTHTQKESALLSPSLTGVIHHGACLPVPYVECRPQCLKTSVTSTLGPEVLWAPIQLARCPAAADITLTKADINLLRFQHSRRRN